MANKKEERGVRDGGGEERSHVLCLLLISVDGGGQDWGLSYHGNKEHGRDGHLSIISQGGNKTRGRRGLCFRKGCTNRCLL